VNEIREIKLKRIRMRSWRRGTKEMDLILGGFSDFKLDSLSDSELSVYDKLLDENDNDLYTWCSGQVNAPSIYKSLLNIIMKN